MNTAFLCQRHIDRLDLCFRLRSFHWFEVGRARLEKGEAVFFHAPITI